MNFTEDEIKHILEVIDIETSSFISIVKAAGLSPEVDFIGADLHGVDFGHDNLENFDFMSADVRGADFSRTKGLKKEMLIGSIYDSTTRWPFDLIKDMEKDSFDYERAAEKLLLMNRRPPAKWAPHIRNLQFNFEKFSNLSLLDNMTNLNTISAFDSSINNLSALTVLKNLTKLELDGCHLNSLAGLENLENLRHLGLARTNINDISMLRSLKSLERLYLSGSTISDISPLQHLQHLCELDLAHTLVKDITAIGNLQCLEKLTLNGTSVRKLSALANAQNLKMLFLEYIQGDTREIQNEIDFLLRKKKNLTVLFRGAVHGPSR